MRWKPERAAGLALVVGLHVAVLWGLMQHRILPMPKAIAPLFVHFIEPPKPLEPEPPKPRAEPPKPARLEPPKPPPPHQHLVVEAPAAPNDYVAPPPPPPPPAPVIEAPAPPAPPPKPAGPVQLSGDLALACPSRTPPAYPALARRMGESGKVVLRVELGGDGRVETARVATSSGYRRLDDAALAAVKNWRCNPPTRDGEPVRAVALQPFNFNLE